MTRQELQASKKHKFSHTGSRRGYVSRKSDLDQLPAEKYDGKYGKGYTVCTPRWDTTQYVNVEYWLEI